MLPLLLLLLSQARGETAGPRCPPDAACQALYNVTDDYYYMVEGKRLTMKYTERDSFKLTCPENVTLDSDALPRFPAPVGVARVQLRGCGLPRGPLRLALRALNLTARDSLELHDVPAPRAPLAAPLDAPPVRALLLHAPAAAPLLAPPGFLAALPAGLRELSLAGVELDPAETLALPAGLEALALEEAGLRELPRAALERLPALRALSLRDARLETAPDVAAAPALRALELHAPVSGLGAGAALENVTLCDARDAELRGEWPALRRLVACNVTRVPPGWLARCPRLSELTLMAPHAGAVVEGALRGAAALRELVVRRGDALALPPALLADAPALRVLDLSSNRLERLPDELLGAPLQLEQLRLTGNRLSARALAPLAAFRALTHLDLSNNPLGDLCDSTNNYVSNDLSPLRDLRSLRVLRLGNARLTRVCRDWRKLPELATVDLRHNGITELRYEDLRWEPASGVEVDLRGNPVATVRYSREDYERALAAVAAPNTSLLLDSRLTCDCLAYWFARALRDRSQHAPPALAALRCRGRVESVRAVPLADLECAVPAESCAPGCACAVSGVDLVLSCAAAGLRELPRAPPGLPPPRELHAPGNLIAALHRDRLPPRLTLLDLRDNLIEELDVDSVEALFEASERRVLLGGNPLRCGCDQRAGLIALAARAARLRDASNVTCVDGRALLELRPADLCGAALDALTLALALLGGLLLPLTVATLACLTRPAVRRRIKRFLLERNLCLRLILRPDDDYEEEDGAEPREYDAFVSFSHGDLEYVRELAARLESGARARRLCLHYRDWPPGEWIPAQIAASVRASRRTVAVVSEHFLRSTWARAEFREAHAAALRDARPRLVVLLLGEPPPDLLDDELRAFLAANTYLRWDDPWFWEKLLHALPRGRSRALPEPAPVPAPAAPAAHAPAAA